MGIGPINAIYQARFNRYLHNRGIKDTSDQRVWAFLGDGEVDEVDTLGAIGLATREKLDNLTFVVNCNLQRLDGPVRGNGKIIQELESIFGGAGWNVIKVIWGRGWDPLLAQDKEGALVNIMNTTLDGDYQTFKGESGAYVREHFFGKDLFDHILGQRAEVPRKPDPAGAIEMAQVLGVPLSECAYVGDSGIDMAFACNSGMTAIGVRWGFRSEAELLEHGAHRLISSPNELL
jgi:hypothetical protein